MLHTLTLHLNGHLLLDEVEAEARTRALLRGPPSARNRGDPAMLAPARATRCGDDPTRHRGCCAVCCPVCCPVCCGQEAAGHGTRRERSLDGAPNGVVGVAGVATPLAPGI